MKRLLLLLIFITSSLLSVDRTHSCPEPTPPQGWYIHPSTILIRAEQCGYTGNYTWADDPAHYTCYTNAYYYDDWRTLDSSVFNDILSMDKASLSA